MLEIDALMQDWRGRIIFYYEKRRYDISKPVNEFFARERGWALPANVLCYVKLSEMAVRLAQKEMHAMRTQSIKAARGVASVGWFAIMHSLAEQHYERLRMQLENEILAYLVNEGVEDDPS